MMAAGEQLADDLELSAMLITAQQALQTVVNRLEETEFVVATACARNALVAATACENQLRQGGPEVEQTS